MATLTRVAFVIDVCADLAVLVLRMARMRALRRTS